MTCCTSAEKAHGQIPKLQSPPGPCKPFPTLHFWLLIQSSPSEMPVSPWLMCLCARAEPCYIHRAHVWLKTRVLRLLQPSCSPGGIHVPPAPLPSAVQLVCKEKHGHFTNKPGTHGTITGVGHQWELSPSSVLDPVAFFIFLFPAPLLSPPHLHLSFYPCPLLLPALSLPYTLQATAARGQDGHTHVGKPCSANHGAVL